MPSAILQRFKQINPELPLWPLALAGLAFLHPEHAYPSICPLKWLGFTWCPGCGLGRSVSYLLHGNLAGSWHTHKLGVFALAVLLHRIVTLAIDTVQACKPFPTPGNSRAARARQASGQAAPSKAGSRAPIQVSSHKIIKTPI
ncbi:MAG TPA: DUF2752 domain-containing protein [Chitinophaga sp.]